jgi:hypothetical protein
VVNIEKYVENILHIIKEKINGKKINRKVSIGI